MRNNVFILVIVLLVGTSSCELLERPTRIETVTIPTYRNEVIVDENGSPVIKEDGSIATTRILTGQKEEPRLIETGEKAPIEEASDLAIPFLGGWGTLVVIAATYASGWATRSRKQKFIEEQSNKT